MSHSARRLPVSTRRALALAFDLTRRDPLHSLVVPFLLRAPWAITLALLPPLDVATDPALVLLVTSVALAGDFLTMLAISSMLRMRARSVYDGPPGTRPAPVSACYAQGLVRVPWLFVTELVRNALLGLAASFSLLPALAVRIRPESFFTDLSNNLLLVVTALCMVIPTLFLGFRLAVATESVVLDERNMSAALIQSFRMMDGRFERWLELIAASVSAIIGLALVTTIVSGLLPLSDTASVAAFWVLVIAVTPVIQYAWTFFYLRLLEIEHPLQEVGPTYAVAGGNGDAGAPLDREDSERQVVRDM